MLASDIRNSTADVDAVFVREGEFIYEVQAEIARALRLPEDWINQAVKRSAPPVGGAVPNLFPFGEYPENNAGAVGLRVFLPTPKYLLAMKLMANRMEGDLDKKATDEQDIVGLMQVTGVVTREDLVALLVECYPSIPGIAVPRVHPRIQAKIDTVLEQFDAERPSATWNASSGPATR